MPGSIIVAAIFKTTVAAFTIGQTMLAFAINMIASSILSRVFAPDAPTFDGTRYPNPEIVNKYRLLQIINYLLFMALLLLVALLLTFPLLTIINKFIM